MLFRSCSPLLYIPPAGHSFSISKGDYEPSAELQELYDMLAADDAHVEVKPEPVDVEIPGKSSCYAIEQGHQ